jgi:hypothetical protein
MPIRLRRHHVLCALTYDGQGYTDAYIANISRLVFSELGRADGGKKEILITADADAICAPCPHRRGLCCDTEDLVSAMDAAHGEMLDLEPGDRLTWAECRTRVLERIVPDDLQTLCAGCSWLAGGTCQASLQRHLSKT